MRHVLESLIISSLPVENNHLLCCLNGLYKNWISCNNKLLKLKFGFAFTGKLIGDATECNRQQIEGNLKHLVEKNEVQCSI